MERKTSEQPVEVSLDEQPDESLVEMVLSEHVQIESSAPGRIEGVVIGTVAAIGPAGEPLVNFLGNAEGSPIPARATITIGPDAIGREVALMFEGGDPNRPIALGLIQVPTRQTVTPTNTPIEGFDVQADGERVVLSAKQEIVIRCGKASITLTSAGKILIRGAYLLTRSSGVNRIQGGSVQIN